MPRRLRLSCAFEPPLCHHATRHRTHRHRRTAMADFIAGIEAIRREGITREPPTDVLGRILGSAFGVEQLQRDLDDFVERTRGVTISTR